MQTGGGESRGCGHTGPHAQKGIGLVQCPACSCHYTILNNLIIIIILAGLGLYCCPWAFSSCTEFGTAPPCGARASHCGGVSCCGAQALGEWAPGVAARRLGNCSLRALGHGLSSFGAQA